MPKTISWGHSDTPVTGVTKLTLNRPVLNFPEDFRSKSKTPGEVVITNLTTPLDRPEQFRFATSDIRNIYSATDIDESVYAPSKRGVSILSQITDTITVSDDADADFRIDLPLSAHLVVKVPASEYIDAGIVEKLVARLVSSLYETGKDDATRLDSMLRGSLSPKGM